MNNKSLLFITLVLLFGFGVLYWLLKPVPNTWEKDSDRDGLVDDVDMEDSTRWIGDTSSYPLSAFVDAFGKVDSIKTKPLCDCWSFQEIADRMVLKCQDNTNWFVFNWKLYHYQDGDFYSANNQRISTSDDDIIENYHKIRFPRGQRPFQDTNALTTFTYRSQKYQIKQGFLSEDGMMFGGARWRYYENTWKRSDDSSSPYDNWKTVRQADIDFLLSQKATKVGSGQTGTGETGTGQTGTGQTGTGKTGTGKTGTGQTGTGKTGTGKTDIENPPAGADDQYWIDLHHKSDFTSDEQNQIKANFNNKNNLSSAGRKARKKVMAKFQD